MEVSPSSTFFKASPLGVWLNHFCAANPSSGGVPSRDRWGYTMELDDTNWPSLAASVLAPGRPTRRRAVPRSGAPIRSVVGEAEVEVPGKEQKVEVAQEDQLGESQSDKAPPSDPDSHHEDANVPSTTEPGEQPKVCMLLVHGSRTATAMQLTYELAKSQRQLFVAWEGPLKTGPSFGAAKTRTHLPTFRQASRSPAEKALYKLKQDQEDLGDQHLLRSVAFEVGDANEDGAEDDWAAKCGLLIHVCAESRNLEESESDILVSMEEGAMETRKSLRFLSASYQLLQQTAGVLLFLLPHTEAANSACMRSAAHQTSRIVDQNPLRHKDGVPCTFALHPQQECPATNVELISSWLDQLLSMPKRQWNTLAGRVVPLQRQP